MTNRDNDFLSRWSRRKAESRDGGLRRKTPDDARPPDPAARQDEPAAAPEPATKPAAALKEADRPAEAAELSFADELRREEAAPVVAVNTTPASREDESEDLTEEQIAEFADVDFDKLDYDTDYTRFMREGVPQAIRRRALRALWGSNPILANVDGLNDYDDDFSDAALAIKIVGSNYTPGRGYLTEEEHAALSGKGEQSVEDETARAESAEADGGEDDIGEGEDEFAGMDEPDAQEPDPDRAANAEDAVDADTAIDGNDKS